MSIELAEKDNTIEAMRKQIGWLKGDTTRLTKNIRKHQAGIVALTEVHKAELAAKDKEIAALKAVCGVPTFKEEGMLAVGNALNDKDKKIAWLRELLKRAKKTFEPFPVSSDLKAMSKFLREGRSEGEIEKLKASLKEYEAVNRKLYEDIEQALAGGKE